MKLITLDFETFYSKQFSLSKLTTEEYIRSPFFEVIGVATKIDDEDAIWVTGGHENVRTHLESLDLQNHAVLCQNTMFDGAILSFVFGIHPKLFLDTMLMSRAVRGVHARHSLKILAEEFDVGNKGTEVLDALGKRLGDFTQSELDAYGRYCKNDVDLTYKIFKELGKDFPKKELQLIDLTLKMFTRPLLRLDTPKLETHLTSVQKEKEELLSKVNLSRKELMSNKIFAELLKERGVEPPLKISPRTGKETFALAKSDEGFKKLLEHSNLEVQALANARLGIKSTLEETRTQRFIDISNRGSFGVPLSYCGAHTTRWSGLDKINLQNLPSRGENANSLKKCILAPEGHVLIDADSAQIEARVLAWFAKQNDLVKQFENKEDVYKIMASRIYKKNIDDISKEERFMGKSVILGCGYGMGHKKFRMFLKSQDVEISEPESHHIVSTYRFNSMNIANLWNETDHALRDMLVNRKSRTIGNGAIEVRTEDNAFVLPSGLKISYPNLRTHKSGGLVYDSRNGMTFIYGAKAVENIVQGMARCVIGEQLIKIAKKYPVVLTVHDAVMCVAPEEEKEDAQKYVEDCMRYVPEWAEGLPLNCESGIGLNYGDCK